MTRTLLRLALAAAAGFALLAGGATAAGATTEPSAAQCSSSKWHVTQTTGNARTLQECGGETMAARSDTGGSTEASTGRDELPLTGASALLAAGLALALMGMGAGLHLTLRRQRRIFTA
jgi:hypothetical protein